MRHIIYIPGLGDRYDGIRKLGLRLWRSKDTRVSHIAMNWLDPDETLEGKLGRIKAVINAHPNEPVTLVGESAGGAMVLVASHRFKGLVHDTVTLCGMNQGSGNVRAALYKRNRAFRDAMVEADTIISNLTNDDKNKLYVVYSSADYTVRPKDTLIDGVESKDIKTPGHMFAILDVLFLRSSVITKRQ